MVVFSTVPPVIVTAPSNYTALEGSDLTLFCKATGNPQPDITWTKIGDITLLSTSETLNLTNLRGEDNGAVYNCEVNNSLGFDTVSASITVMCEFRLKKSVQKSAHVDTISALHFVIKSSLKSNIVNH